jgi:hypothetical protein
MGEAENLMSLFGHRRVECWKILGIGFLGLYLGCLSPFHENEHHLDTVFGNVILRYWGWDQKKLFGPCSTSGYVCFSDSQLLDRNESSLVNHVHGFLVQGERPNWGVATVSVSLETYRLQPYIEVLDLERGTIRATLRLPAEVESGFNPQFDPSGSRLLLACREGRSTASLYMVTWGQEPSLKCLYREDGKVAFNHSPTEARQDDQLATGLWSPDGQSIAVIVSVGAEWDYPSTVLIQIRLDGSRPEVVQQSENRPWKFAIQWNQNSPVLVEMGRRP